MSKSNYFRLKGDPVEIEDANVVLAEAVVRAANEVFLGVQKTSHLGSGERKCRKQINKAINEVVCISLGRPL